MGRGVPPGYVFGVLADRVLLSGDLSSIYRMLRASPYRAQTSRETPSTVAVAFPGEGGGTTERDELLWWLAEHGVAFAEKCPGRGSVASFARGLQEKGTLPRRVAVIRWLNQDEWKVLDQIVAAGGMAAAASV